MMRHAPLDRVDSYLIAALAGATGVDRVIRAAADAESLARVAVRFVEVPLISWAYHGAPVFRRCVYRTLPGRGPFRLGAPLCRKVASRVASRRSADLEKPP
jgi:hypothetical protein